jgi:hypothetical protein
LRLDRYIHHSGLIAASVGATGLIAAGVVVGKARRGSLADDIRDGALGDAGLLGGL